MPGSRETPCVLHESNHSHSQYFLSSLSPPPSLLLCFITFSPSIQLLTTWFWGPTWGFNFVPVTEEGARMKMWSLPSPAPRVDRRMTLTQPKQVTSHGRWLYHTYSTKSGASNLTLNKITEREQPLMWAGVIRKAPGSQWDLDSALRLSCCHQNWGEEIFQKRVELSKTQGCRAN